jgi:hypothetical protein
MPSLLDGGDTAEDEEKKLPMFLLEEIPKKTKLLDCWPPNSLLRMAINSQVFDFLRTDAIACCMSGSCKKEFDPGETGAASIHNVLQHVRSKHLGEKNLVSLMGSSKVSMLGACLTSDMKKQEEKLNEKMLRRPHLPSFFHSANNKKQQLNSAVLQAAE